MERLSLLVSDVDNTLLGDDRALAKFRAWYERAKDHLRLVYSSGRFPGSIRDSIESSGLPEPDAIIGGVGTEIFEVATGKRLNGWPPIDDGWNPDVVRSTCGRHDELETQPEHLLSDYKISYYGYDLDEEFLADLAQELAAAGQHVKIVYSSKRDLDVLPAEADKGQAAAFLAKRWGIDRDRVIVAGDSGNDLDMFDEGFRGIVVGNAHPELRSLRDPNVYQATEKFAAGVVEGLRHWLPDISSLVVTHDRSSSGQDAGRGTRG